MGTTHSCSWCVDGRCRRKARRVNRGQLVAIVVLGRGLVGYHRADATAPCPGDRGMGVVFRAQ